MILPIGVALSWSYKMKNAAVAMAMVALAGLSGCASLMKPSDERLASLPVVTFPQTPSESKQDFVLKLPAGQPIPTHVAIAGSALATTAEQTLTVTLPRDLYVYRNWVSEDREHWRHYDEVIAISLSISLPSQEWPKPGEINLKIDSKGTRAP